MKKMSFGELNSDCDKAAEKVITGNHTDGGAAVLRRGGVTNTPVSDCLASFSKSILSLLRPVDIKSLIIPSNIQIVYQCHWRWEVKK